MQMHSSGALTLLPAADEGPHFGFLSCHISHNGAHTLAHIHAQGPYRAYQLQTADLTCGSLAQLTVYNIRRLFVSWGRLGGRHYLTTSCCSACMPHRLPACVCAAASAHSSAMPQSQGSFAARLMQQTAITPQANRGQEMMDVQQQADWQQWDSEKRKRSQRRLGIATCEGPQ